jgi:hypothetical protein
MAELLSVASMMSMWFDYYMTPDEIEKKLDTLQNTLQHVQTTLAVQEAFTTFFVEQLGAIKGGIEAGLSTQRKILAETSDLTETQIKAIQEKQREAVVIDFGKYLEPVLKAVEKIQSPSAPGSGNN